MYLIEILQRCSAIATRTAAVYRQLAERFDRDDDRVRLWRELALAEETHADVLEREMKTFQESDQSGNFLPDFAERLDLLDSELQVLETQASSASTPDDVLAISVALEQTTLEDLYDDLVLQCEPSFRLIMERVESALSQRPGAPPAAGMARRAGRP